MNLNINATLNIAVEALASSRRGAARADPEGPGRHDAGVEVMGRMTGHEGSVMSTTRSKVAFRFTFGSMSTL